jgi:hypothetical protein
MAAAKIAALPGISSERSLPGAEADWNDMLKSLQKAERTQNRVRDSGMFFE